eukprot:Nk52_evm5s1892 gene=Nk52_evmTU5s1892
MCARTRICQGVRSTRSRTERQRQGSPRIVKEDILRTPIWQWVKRALIPREIEHAERKVLDKQVKGWHRKWEKIKCDRLEAWFNEDTNSFFSVEEMLNHFDREARADQLSAEEIAKTREVIKLLDTSLTACLRGKQRSPLLEGDWVRLQEEGPRNDLGERDALILRADDLMEEEVTPTPKYMRRWQRIIGEWNISPKKLFDSLSDSDSLSKVDVKDCTYNTAGSLFKGNCGRETDRRSYMEQSSRTGANRSNARSVTIKGMRRSII